MTPIQNEPVLIAILFWQVVDTFGGAGALRKYENQLSYPLSIYANLKAGFPGS